jgi:hypothetical protein
MVRKALFVFSLFVLAVGVSASIATADTLPSGERNFHNATLEPAYNAENAGQIGYLFTPNKAPMMANPAAWSPLYVVVYPTSTTVTATLNCMHVPFENCPSHGDDVAGAAAQIMSSVYGDGVLGHDHVGDFPGGADFNFAWEPVLVLFTSKDAANHHLVTDTQIATAVANHNAIEVPVSALTFNCSWVSRSLWNMATPIATG